MWDAESRHRIVVVMLWVAALATLAILAFIIGVVLWNGLPMVTWSFLLESPKDMGRAGGIFPTIVGTIAVTLLAVLIAAPLGAGTAVYLTEYTSETLLTRVIRFGAECLAGIPSIIFGLFGFIFFVIKLKMGWSVLSGALTLAVMILPTVMRTAEEAIKSVPESFREASFSTGATRWQTVTQVVLPSALPGIVTGIVLGIGRGVGETAAVIFTAGSSLHIPTSVFSPARTMAVHFYILAREGLSMDHAYGTAAVLVLLILVINTVANWLMLRFRASQS
jgi:phosphate transport system permease protein